MKNEKMKFEQFEIEEINSEEMDITRGAEGCVINNQGSGWCVFANKVDETPYSTDPFCFIGNQT